MRVHFTLLLFALWAAVAARESGILYSLGVGIGVLVFVGLHELAHLLVSRRLGYQSGEVVLYPVGGVPTGTLGRVPPREELKIAFSGPIFSLILALLFGAWSILEKGEWTGFAAAFSEGPMTNRIAFINFLLCVFNLIPAFPMDGGRIIRALIALRYDANRATILAARIGQTAGITIAVCGILFSLIVLVLLGMILTMGATQEAALVLSKNLLRGHKVRDAMVTNFVILHHNQTFNDAAKELLATSQADFPIQGGDSVIGVLTREDVVEGLNSDGPDAYLAGKVRRENNRVTPDTELQQALPLLSIANTLLVFDGDNLVGLLTKENVTEFLMLANARQRHLDQPDQK